MKFTIEVEDFWLEDGELSEALESHVTRDVVNTISANIKDKVELELTKKIDEIVKDKLEVLIDVHLGNFMEKGEIVRNGEKRSIVEYLKHLFEADRGWSSVDGKIKSYSKKFAEQMVLQYDAAFANRIVVNMKKQGLLKDDVVKILLEGK